MPISLPKRFELYHVNNKIFLAIFDQRERTIFKNIWRHLNRLEQGVTIVRLTNWKAIEMSRYIDRNEGLS